MVVLRTLLRSLPLAIFRFVGVEIFCLSLIVPYFKTLDLFVFVAQVEMHHFVTGSFPKKNSKNTFVSDDERTFVEVPLFLHWSFLLYSQV